MLDLSQQCHSASRIRQATSRCSGYVGIIQDEDCDLETEQCCTFNVFRCPRSLKLTQIGEMMTSSLLNRTENKNFTVDGSHVYTRLNFDPSGLKGNKSLTWNLGPGSRFAFYFFEWGPTKSKFDLFRFPHRILCMSCRFEKRRVGLFCQYRVLEQFIFNCD